MAVALPKGGAAAFLVEKIRYTKLELAIYKNN
jgi:hypothetical protein